MARITTHRGSAKDTQKYYLADYYDAGPEFAGQWLGRGAELLGLKGEVDSKQFMRLLENRHPLTNQKLSARNRPNRRNGWDITFSAPKSVSIAFGITGDSAIVDALREATNETLLEAEQDVMRRVNLAGGKQQHKKTANFVSAVWVHPDARSVDGQVPDVQLHTHGFLGNATMDFSTNRWFAADISNIFRDAQGYYEAAFQSRLASKIQGLGYDIERSKNDFEISGISRDLIEKFSKRSAQINQKVSEGYAEELAAKRGISLADAKGMIGALSRDAKNKTYTLEELRQHWTSQLTPDEIDQLERVTRTRQRRKPKRRQQISAKEAVDYALSHGFENEAVLRERNALRDAIKYGIEGNSVEAIRSELGKRNLVRQGKDETAILTTRELQQEEQEILDYARFGKGQLKPLNPAFHVGNTKLSDEQRQAVQGLLHSSDRLQILRGVAGVGKSYMMQTLVPAITETDTPVAMMAPTNKATDNLNEDGFHATTVQSFLVDDKAQENVKDGVIVVDESGLVGTPTFLSLIRVAEQKNARIIAVGDANQHQPIERGHPLKMLEEQAGIVPKEVTRIRRQKGSYKKAVAALSRHDIVEGFTRFRTLGSVHEIADEDRDKKLASDFADARQSNKNHKLLVIAPTHAERRRVTEAIREELKSRGLIKGKERELTTLVPKQLSKAQRQDPLNFEAGDVVAFHAKGQGGIQSGDQLTVTRATKDKVVAGAKEIPLESAGAFAVFRPETSNYAVGDVIRLTRGRRQDASHKKLTNGSLHTIKSFNKGTITLDSGEKLAANWRFFDQGVAVTSHVSQGTTVHRAFVAASTLSFPAAGPEQMYVSASRAKKSVDIYTDSADGLLNAIQRIRPKQLATDVRPDAYGTRTHRLSQRFDRIKTIAHQFATKQLHRFHDWMPSRHMQPQLER